MPKRLNPMHQDMVRQKIQATYLVNTLTNHIKGKRKLSATQVRSVEILLNKSLSNAPQQMQLTGNEGAPLAAPVVNVVFTAAKPDG